MSEASTECSATVPTGLQLRPSLKVNGGQLVSSQARTPTVGIRTNIVLTFMYSLRVIQILLSKPRIFSMNVL